MQNFFAVHFDAFRSSSMKKIIGHRARFYRDKTAGPLQRHRKKSLMSSLFLQCRIFLSRMRAVLLCKPFIQPRNASSQRRTTRRARAVSCRSSGRLQALVAGAPVFRPGHRLVDLAVGLGHFPFGGTFALALAGGNLSRRWRLGRLLLGICGCGRLRLRSGVWRNMRHRRCEHSESNGGGQHDFRHGVPPEVRREQGARNPPARISISGCIRPVRIGMVDVGRRPSSAGMLRFWSLRPSSRREKHLGNRSTG